MDRAEFSPRREAITRSQSETSNDGNPAFKPTTADASDMLPTVECCISNRNQDLRSVLDRDDVEFRERRCLEHCGICRNGSFAVVDGRLVTAPDLSSATDALVDGTATGKPR